MLKNHDLLLSEGIKGEEHNAANLVNLSNIIENIYQDFLDLLYDNFEIEYLCDFTKYFVKFPSYDLVKGSGSTFGEHMNNYTTIVKCYENMFNSYLNKIFYAFYLNKFGIVDPNRKEGTTYINNIGGNDLKNYKLVILDKSFIDHICNMFKISYKLDSLQKIPINKKLPQVEDLETMPVMLTNNNPYKHMYDVNYFETSCSNIFVENPYCNLKLHVPLKSYHNEALGYFDLITSSYINKSYNVYCLNTFKVNNPVRYTNFLSYQEDKNLTQEELLNLYNKIDNKALFLSRVESTYKQMTDRNPYYLKGYQSRIFVKTKEPTKEEIKVAKSRRKGVTLNGEPGFIQDIPVPQEPNIHFGHGMGNHLEEFDVIWGPEAELVAAENAHNQALLEEEALHNMVAQQAAQEGNNIQI